MASKSTDTN